MGRLTIRKVIYEGDNYHFQSPTFGDGLNIILGKNGNGKTTFINLIYFGLGGNVPEFNKESKNDNRHNEIYNDDNNYVRLFVEINNQIYILTRYFAQNYIFITDIAENKNQSFRVNRYEGCEIFSDWILDKLGINVFQIYQGTKKWKINFTDLMRLIYYDQKTQVDKIYKNLEYNSFLTDSESFRKAIFEILMGKTYNEYYESLAKYNAKLKEKNAKKDSLEMFRQFKDEILKEENMNSVHLNELKEKYVSDLEKYKLLREDARNFTNAPDIVIDDIEIKRNKLLELEFRYTNISQDIIKKNNEIKNLSYLYHELKNDIEQIQKIKFLHNRLSLFSPDTCPYCLKRVKRNEGKCICGSDICEDEYEKFFYTEDEYVDMILSKKKSLESLEFAILSCKEDIDIFNNQLKKVDEEKKNLKINISDLSKEIYSSYNSEKVKEYDDVIVGIKEKISKINQSLEIEIKREKLDSELVNIEKAIETLENLTNTFELQAQRDIVKKRDIFSEVYKEYMTNVDKDCMSARINTDYMPVINNGLYRENSASVHKRLMYFFTLLNMAVQSKETNHPKLLLVDTPSKEGIDKENLLKSLLQIKSLYKLGKKPYKIYTGKFKNKFSATLKNIENKELLISRNNFKRKFDFQIILTTGYDTYPKEFESKVLIRLEDDDKLLKEKNNGK